MNSLSFRLTCTLILFRWLPVLQGEEENFDSKSRQKRVIGGSEIGLGEWPWLVHLKGKIPVLKIFGIPVLHKTFYCGASLINEQWLLTAAHCFSATDSPKEIQEPKYWHAKLGDVDSTHTFTDRVKSLLSDVVDEPKWKMWYFHAEKIIIHPRYDERDDWKHDIALVKLDSELDLTDQHVSHIIRPVVLPPQSYWLNEEWPQPTSLCIMKGWGCTKNGGPVSSIARATILPVLERNNCVFRDISSTRLCAGYTNSNSGICPGDSGGPLVCSYNHGHASTWVQAGIASFTSAVRPDSVPGVFTKVDNYVDWIWETIGTNS